MIKKQEHFEHCKEIAKTLEAYANGEFYICPECGEHVKEGDTCCNEQVNPYEWEQCSLYDYFSDVLDVEYRVGSDKEYRSVRLMVAFGGPNIYIDTGTKRVELYWWTETGEYMLDRDVCDMIDEMFSEVFAA